MITKLHILVLSAIAGLGVGCAMDAQPNEDPIQQTENRVTANKANTPAAAKNTETLGEEAPKVNGVAVKASNIVIIKTETVLGGGETDDGPRPHPWEPNPDQSDTSKTSDTNTNSNNSSSTSSTK